MPSTMGLPPRSLKRAISLPMLVYLPDCCHSDAGMTTGNSTSWPSIASISSRIIFCILRDMRWVGMKNEYIPLATGFMYPPLVMSIWLIIWLSSETSLRRSPRRFLTFIVCSVS